MIRERVIINVIECMYIYRNGELQQVNNDYGYWADSTYHYYIKDYQGNIRAVIAQDGTLEEINNYYPYGSLMGGAAPGVQPFKYGAKELDRQNGINLYDSQARFYDPIICRTTNQDPLAEKYYSTSPYLWCAGNPMKYVDENGGDTININYTNNRWNIMSVIIAKGDDIFNISDNGTKTSITFYEESYGNRVNALNLESSDKYTLGIYHISGSDNGGTGFFVTPGGDPSIKLNSGKRIPEGEYPIIAPSKTSLWKQPGIGGVVSERGIRFHYGKGFVTTNGYTKGCFILSTKYEIVGDNILLDKDNSMTTVQNFDYNLGGSEFFKYTIKGKTRYGSHFKNDINKTLILKSR